MQLKTRDKYSAAVMLEGPGKLEGRPAEGNWWMFDHGSEATGDPFASVGIDPPQVDDRFKR